MVSFYFHCALAPSTHRAYNSAKKRYTNFCSQAELSPLPAGEDKLCLYVSHLARSGLRHQTIKCYLSAVRHLQIEHGRGDPFLASMPKLEQVVKGIKGHQAKQGSQGSRTRLPVTPEVLKKIRSALSQQPSDFNNIMIWAACCLCYFVFLRSGEICVPLRNEYDAGAHLSHGDVAVDSQSKPTLLAVKIKASKTDPFRKGVRIFIGRTDCDLCPLAAVLAYLAVRGDAEGPLFRFANSNPLSRDAFVREVRRALSVAGVNADLYSGHSFRIGAATVAAAAGIEDSTIMTLDRWNSSAYLRYIRTPRELLASLSKRLTSQPAGISSSEP